MIKFLSQKLLVRVLIFVLGTVLVLSFLYASRIMDMIKQKKSITVLAWAQVLDSTFLYEFEQETGVKVYIRYFESNEEVLVKLQSTDSYGYDLIMPSDFIAQTLIEKKLIKPIDKSKLNFLPYLYPEIMGRYFDPLNDYTIPFFWGTLVLGIDTDYFKDGLPDASWDLIFNGVVAPQGIGLLDSARELAMVAAFYLFNKVDNLTYDEIEQVKQLLIKQKSWVQIYTEMRGEYLLASHSCPVMMIFSSDIVKVMRKFDYINFVLPREGSFAVIDSFAIPISSDKDEIIYAFLNYLYRPDVLQKYVDKFGFFPPTHNVRPAFIREGVTLDPAHMLKQVDFFRNVIPKSLLNNIWICLKA